MNKFFLSWYYLLAVTIALVCSVSYLSSIKDGDLFWHVKTGEYIWQNHTLPKEDPFSFTLALQDSYPEVQSRIETILTGYWLGDIGLYLLWDVAGAEGITVARATIYFMILVFLAWWMGLYGKSTVNLLLVCLVGLQLQFFPNERPQLFAYLIAPIFMYYLEKLRENLQNNDVKTVVIPCCLIIFWANLHGSYLVGQVLVSIYLICAIVAKSNSQNNRYIIKLIAIFLAGFAQPNPLDTIVSVFRSIGTVALSVKEYTPTVEFGLNNETLYPYFIAVAISVVSIAVFYKKNEIVKTLVVLSLLVLSLSAVRYVPFFLFALPLVSQQIKINNLYINVMLIGITTALMFYFTHIEPYKMMINPFLFPTKAANFINRELPSGKMFNYVDWGGYLMVSCPKYKVFADARYLSSDVANDHDNIMGGDLSLLDKYGIAFVVIPGTNNIVGEQYYAETYPIIVELAFNKEWALVYSDDVAAVFVRRSNDNRRLVEQFELPPARAMEHVNLRRKWQLGI